MKAEQQNNKEMMEMEKEIKKYKVMTKDRQWTMREDLTEQEAVEYYCDNIMYTVASLDRVILDQDNNVYEVILDGHRKGILEIHE